MCPQCGILLLLWVTHAHRNTRTLCKPCTLSKPHFPTGPNPNQANLVLRSWAPSGWWGRISEEVAACVINTVTTCLGKRRETGKAPGASGQRNTLWKAELLLKSIKWSGWAGSLQNLSHQLAFTVTVSCIKYNKRDMAWNMQSFGAFFLYYWCISNGMRFPVLLFLCTTCFIKEPIKNLKLFFVFSKWSQNWKSEQTPSCLVVFVRAKKSVLQFDIFSRKITVKEANNNNRPKHIVIKSWGSHE